MTAQEKASLNVKASPSNDVPKMSKNSSPLFNIGVVLAIITLVVASLIGGTQLPALMSSEVKSLKERHSQEISRLNTLHQEKLTELESSYSTKISELQNKLHSIMSENETHISDIKEKQKQDLLEQEKDHLEKISSVHKQYENKERRYRSNVRLIENRNKEISDLKTQVNTLSSSNYNLSRERNNFLGQLQAIRNDNNKLLAENSRLQKLSKNIIVEPKGSVKFIETLKVGDNSSGRFTKTNLVVAARDISSSSGELVIDEELERVRVGNILRKTIGQYNCELYIESISRYSNIVIEMKCYNLQ